MKCKNCMVTALLALCIMLGAFPALAEPTGGDKWNFRLAPYAWLAGQRGTVATLPPLPAADIDVDFYDDVLGDINGGLLLVGEARKEPLGIVIDIVYADIETEDPAPLGIFYSAVNSRTKTWLVSGAGLYTLIEGQNRFLDVIGGVRYWSVDADLSLKGPRLPSLKERSLSNKEEWLDPIVGLKGRIPIGGAKFFASGSFVIGGFGAGSDFMWDATMNFGLDWTKGFSTAIGYRYLDVDYENGGFRYDVVQQGPLLGLSWRF